jgi:hypothetical protein
MSNTNNNQGNRGLDPQPEHGKDQKGHQDNNGNGNKPPTRPTKPATSHAVTFYG